MPVKRRPNIAKTDRGSYYIQEWLEEFLDSKGAFSMVMKSDNNESYNENNEQQQLPEGFANSCYKSFTNSSTFICKHYSGTLLLAEDVSHSFGKTTYLKKEPHFFQINLEHASFLCYVA